MLRRKLHRWSGGLIAAFVLLHIANHLAGLGGVARHIAVMEALRPVYRNPLAETLLLVAVAIQLVTGLRFIWAGRGRRKPAVARLQAASGAYLTFFLLVHVSAVLGARHLLGLDTNIYFAAAGFHVSPYFLFFWPYYTLAVLAVFTHLGCAGYRLAGRGRRGGVVLGVALGFGATVGLLIAAMLAGLLAPLDVPAAYLAPYP